jgi:hypothetical protein
MEAKEVRPPGAEAAEKDVTRDTKAFTSAIRQRIFTFLRGLVNEDFESAIDGLNSPIDPDGQPWTVARLQQGLAEYYVEHRQICLDPEARNLRHTYIVPSEDKKTWRVQQMLVDPEGHNDWVAEFAVDLTASRQADEPVIGLRRVAALN